MKTRGCFRHSLFLAMMLGGACALPAIVPPAAVAGDNPTYANVIPRAVAVTMHAKISAIDRQTRQVTLKGRAGESVTLVAGPMVRLELLKVGDAVNATYYRSVAFVVSQPGTAVPENEMRMALARPAEAPGGVAVTVSRMSGLVVGIDLAAHSVDLVDPNGGGVYTVDVVDPQRQAQLDKLHVGDTITAVVSETLAGAIDPAPNSWF